MRIITAITIIVCTLLFLSILAPLLNPGEGYHLTEFQGGGVESTITFPSGGGTSTVTNIEVEKGSQIESAKLQVEGLADGSGKYPENVTVDVGNDGDEEWKFKGSGYGALGKQIFFNTSRQHVMVPFADAGFDDSVGIYLPKNATVTSATMRVTGLGSGSIVINEFNTGSDWAEVYNYGGPQDMSGWVFWWHDQRPYQGTYVIPAGFTLGMNAFVCIHETSGTNTATDLYMDSNIMWTPSSSNGIAAEIRDNNGMGVDFFKTTGDASTPTAPTLWNTPHVAYPVTGDVGRRTGDLDTNTGNDWAVGGTATMKALNAGQTGIGGGGSGGPDNPALDIGNNGGAPDWSHSGTFETTVVTPDFSTELNNILSGRTPKFTDDYGNIFCEIPVMVSAQSPGAVHLSDLQITYTYQPQITINPDTGSLMNSLNAQIPDDDDGENTTVVVAVETDSGGKVRLFNLDLFYNAPPIFYEIPPQLFTDEDTQNTQLLDLSLYTIDDIDTFSELSFEVVFNSEEANVGVSVTEGFLAVDTTVVPNWNSEDYYEIFVQLKVSDTGGRSMLSNMFSVYVNPVNDEPVPAIEIPDISVPEGETDSSTNLDTQTYFTDVENDYLDYTVQVDPLDVFDGENLTAEITQHSNMIKVAAVGDFTTGDGDGVPIYVFCDDDEDVDTIEDGNYCCQIVLVSVEPVNDAPVWSSIDPIIMIEDTPQVDILDLSLHATDIETPSDELEYTMISNNQRQAVVATIDSENKIDISSLKQDWTGKAEIEVEVADEEDEVRTKFIIDVQAVNDAPSVTLTSHKDGAQVTGIITFIGTTSDIEHDPLTIEMKIDEGEWAEVDRSGVSWNHLWDTTVVSNGGHSIQVRSFDGVLYSDEVSLGLNVLNIANVMPTVVIYTPEDNQTVSGMVLITGGATDEIKVTNVSIRFDNGPWMDVNGTITWNYMWHTNNYTDGEHEILVKAYDGELFSLIVNMSVNIKNQEEEDTIVEEEDDTGVSDEGSGFDSYWWVIILIIIIVVIAIIITAYAYSNKKKREQEEERERLEAERAKKSFPTAQAVTIGGKSSPFPTAPPASPLTPPGGQGLYSPAGGGAFMPVSTAGGYGSAVSTGGYGASQGQALAPAGPPQQSLQSTQIAGYLPPASGPYASTQGAYPYSHSQSPYSSQATAPVASAPMQSSQLQQTQSASPNTVSCFSCGAQIQMSPGQTIITCHNCGAQGKSA